jgi:hypothetical protein
VHPRKKGNVQIPMSTQSQDAAEDYTGASYPDYAKDAGACEVVAVLFAGRHVIGALLRPSV